MSQFIAVSKVDTEVHELAGSNHVVESVVESEIDRVAGRAIRWLLNSGIQINSRSRVVDGGFACWYDQETQSSPYVYAEITGYMLTLLAWLHSRKRDTRIINSAVRAADWLLEIANERNGGFPCLVPLQPNRFDYKRDFIYAFDCGIILSGLVNLYRLTGIARYLAASVTVADWMLRDVQDERGAFQPVFNNAENEWLYNEAEWSLCSGGYHTKIAIGLINLYDATKSAKYLRAATKACDFALTFQQPDGRFVTFPGEGGTNTHPHAYAAEGLWVVGKYLGREDYLQASARATEWLFSVQSAEGFVPRHWHNGQAQFNERVDVLSQAMRLAEIHRAEGRLHERFEPKVAQLLPLILRNQSDTSDKRADGAFYFGRLSNGDVVPHANVWVTSFALQALLLREDRCLGRAGLNPLYMV